MLNKRLKDLYPENLKLFEPILTEYDAVYKDLGSELDRYLYKKYRNILLINDFDNNDVRAWFAGVSYNMDCLYLALMKEYEPLQNYDMHEAGADGRSVAQSTTTTSQQGKLINLQTIPSKTLSHYTTTFDNASTGRLESYDTEIGSNDNPTEQGSPVTRSTTYQEADAGTNKKGIESVSKFDNTVTGGADDIEATANEVTSHELKRSGNIGVTTSQQMLQSEIDLRAAANFFNIFGERFVEDCTTGMYASSYGVREEYIPWL